MNNKDVVLHIAPTPFFSDRGCHIRIAGIVRSIGTLGFLNKVCTYHLGYDLPDIDTARIRVVKGYTKTAPGPSPYKIIADFRLLVLVCTEFRKIRPIALHAHLHEGVLIAVLAKLLLLDFKTPIVADMQGSLVGELDNYGFFKKFPFPRFIFKWLERALLYFATTIVCSSDHALENFSSEYPESSEKMRLVQDGADEIKPGSKASQEAKRKELGLDPSKLCVVYSGVLIESKGLEQLQGLIDACRAEENRIQFLVIGYPVEGMVEFLKERGLSHMCVLTGRVEFDTLRHYLELSDVAVDPKKSDAGEGSGKMLNYLASGLPVVAFDTKNNQVFLGGNTTLCNDISEMKDMLIRFERDSRFRDAEGAANHEIFKNRYSWNVTASQLDPVYTELCKARSAVKGAFKP